MSPYRKGITVYGLLVCFFGISILSAQPAARPAPANRPTTANRNANPGETLIRDNGFDKVIWGDPYIYVLDNTFGEIEERSAGEYIVSRKGELNIRYGFFRDPSAPQLDLQAYIRRRRGRNNAIEPLPAVNTNRNVNNPPADNERFMEPEEVRKKQIDDAARLFYVTIRVPYIKSELVEKKLRERFGQVKGKKIEKTRGVLWWETETNRILLWIDEVHGVRYTRKIDLIGIAMQDQVKARQSEIYNEYERKILEDLNL